MNNTQNFRFVSIGLAGLLAVGVTGCQLFKKKQPAKPESTPPQGKPPQMRRSRRTDRQRRLVLNRRPSPPARSRHPPKPAATPPEGPDMTEFAGLPKGEAEFILECRRLGESGGAMVAGRGGVAFSRAELRELGANRASNSTRHRNIIGSLAAYAARVKAGGAEFVLVVRSAQGGCLS